MTAAASRLRWAPRTDVGRYRPANEDTCAANGRIFVVADGMGGHLAGEVASEMAVTTLMEALGTTPPGSFADDAVQVFDAVAEANLRIYESSIESAERHGMGTTLTALVLVGSGAEQQLALVNVGDSRTYVLRDGVLDQLSIDHSYVQELVSAGQITKEDARHHPHRNIVTRALGIEPRVSIDGWRMPLVRGDRFLLCSDGLSDEISDDQIADILARVDDPDAAAAALIEAANNHGGRDNITALVVDVLDGPRPTGRPRLTPLWGQAPPTPEPVWVDRDPTPPHPGPVTDEDRRDITRTMVLPVTEQAPASRADGDTGSHDGDTGGNGNGKAGGDREPAEVDADLAELADRTKVGMSRPLPSAYRRPLLARVVLLLVAIAIAVIAALIISRGGSTPTTPTTPTTVSPSITVAAPTTVSPSAASPTVPATTTPPATTGP